MSKKSPLRIPSPPYDGQLGVMWVEGYRDFIAGHATRVTWAMAPIPARAWRIGWQFAFSQTLSGVPVSDPISRVMLLEYRQAMNFWFAETYKE